MQMTSQPLEKNDQPVRTPARRFLQVTTRKPLNNGHSRLVFEHPDDPSLVVKVLRPDVIEDRFGKGIRWYKRPRRSGPFLSYVREIQEYVAMYSVHRQRLPFLQTVVGLVETDLGLGLVTEAARDRQGNIAPNIAMLIERGQFDSTVRGDLEIYLHQILACDVIISDMNVGNLVYAYSEPDGNHFVLIDGLGNANILPLKSLSRRINRRSKIQRFKRLYHRIATRLENAGYPMPPLPLSLA